MEMEIEVNTESTERGEGIAEISSQSEGVGTEPSRGVMSMASLFSTSAISLVSTVSGEDAEEALLTMIMALAASLSRGELETLMARSLLALAQVKTETAKKPYKPRRRRGETPFHELHVPFASYIRQDLEPLFEELVDKLSQVTLSNKTLVFNQGVYDLLASCGYDLSGVEVPIPALTRYLRDDHDQQERREDE